MGAKKKIVTASVTSGWVSDQSGYERTRSPEIISRILKKLKKDGFLISLYHKDYQSGSTVLIDYGKQLVIGKPPDWPDGTKESRVVFRDEAKLWNQFQVAILSTDRELLKTSLPTELFQLQRRSNYRVDISHGSKVEFVHQNKKMSALYCENVSAGGMLIRMEGPVLLHGDLISDIVISFSDQQRRDNSTSLFSSIQVKRAMVARSFRDEGEHQIWFGIKFLPSIAEEDDLQRYVRRRELEFLKKGVSL